LSDSPRLPLAIAGFLSRFAQFSLLVRGHLCCQSADGPATRQGFRKRTFQCCFILENRSNRCSRTDRREEPRSKSPTPAQRPLPEPRRSRSGRLGARASGVGSLRRRGRRRAADRAGQGERSNQSENEELLHSHSPFASTHGGNKQIEIQEKTTKGFPLSRSTRYLGRHHIGISTCPVRIRIDSGGVTLARLFNLGLSYRAQATSATGQTNSPARKTSPCLHPAYLKSAFVLWTGFELSGFPLVFVLSDGFGALPGVDGPPGFDGVSVFFPEPASVEVMAFDEQPAVPARANAIATQRRRNFFTRVAPSRDHGHESVRFDRQGPRSQGRHHQATASPNHPANGQDGFFGVSVLLEGSSFLVSIRRLV